MCQDEPINIARKVNMCGKKPKVPLNWIQKKLEKIVNNNRAEFPIKKGKKNPKINLISKIILIFVLFPINI